MKNIFEVLSQKETELVKLQTELEALRVAARLLSEEGDPPLASLQSPLATTDLVSEVHTKGPAMPAAHLRQFP